MATQKPKEKVKALPAMAVHAKSKDGYSHIVGLGNIRVILLHDESSDYWFARGLEIDYAAQGDSEADVKARFGEGLCKTISENLKVYGTIDKLLKVAPQDVWTELYGNADTLKKLYSQVSTHRIQRVPLPQAFQKDLPFDGITFIPIPSASGVLAHA
jgi:hypothetical protein